VLREDHERANTSVGVVQALRHSVAAGGGAEREQTRPVASIAPDRKLGAYNDAEAVAQCVQTFDPGGVIHEAEGIAINIELTAVQARPRRHTRAREMALEPIVAPLTFGIVNWIVAAVARIKLPQQLTDDGLLVLLHQVPQRHVDRHATRLDLPDHLRAVV